MIAGLEKVLIVLQKQNLTKSLKQNLHQSECYDPILALGVTVSWKGKGKIKKKGKVENDVWLKLQCFNIFQIRRMIVSFSFAFGLVMMKLRKLSFQTDRSRMQRKLLLSIKCALRSLPT
jgi:hypothetical protein